jgi:hypothetical protein
LTFRCAPFSRPPKPATAYALALAVISGVYMEAELVIIFVTFGLLCVCFGLKRHYHLLYLKETDLRLKGIEKIDDLNMSHKNDLESDRNFKLHTEIIWITFLPTFKTNVRIENSIAKSAAKKIKILLNTGYIVLAILLAEILAYANII